MTKEQKLALMKEKVNKLQNTPKNLKCPGVLRKLRRQVRNLESSM